jgi:hypothetical protein
MIHYTLRPFGKHDVMLILILINGDEHSRRPVSFFGDNLPLLRSQCFFDLLFPVYSFS